MEITNKSVGNKALAMLMVVSVLTAGVVVEVPKASAATPNEDSDFTVTSVAGGVEISTYIGASKDVVIPDTIGGEPVVSIRGVISGSTGPLADGVFQHKQLTSVVIPKSVTKIGAYAFWGNNLTEVVIPEGVTSIGEVAFYDNKLTTVVIPVGVTRLETSVFGGNLFTSFVVPGSVTHIGTGAFYSNQLTSVVIPGSVISIGDLAFDGNQLTPADLTIWGIDPSVAKTHALANGYTFNLGVPNPPQGAGYSQTATLNLEGGDLTLETAEINNFGSIKLKNQPQTVTTGFDDKFTVTDNRGTGLGWRLDVSATQFSEVEPTGGFAGGLSTGFTLPIGSLMINGLDTLERTEGTPGGNPSIAGLSNTVIDGSSLATVSNAGLNEGAGKFALTFGEDALSLVVDSSTAKVDTVNYPSGATPYESTVTWDLVSAP